MSLQSALECCVSPDIRSYRNYLIRIIAITKPLQFHSAASHLYFCIGSHHIAFPDIGREWEWDYVRIKLPLLPTAAVTGWVSAQNVSITFGISQILHPVAEL